MIGYGKYLDSGEMSLSDRGVSAREYEVYSTLVKDVVLGADFVERTGYNEGRYVTLSSTKRSDEVRAGIEVLRQLVEGVDLSRILVVGVGNPRMTTDRLGVETVSRLRSKKLRTLCPSVEGVTGIPSIEVIDSVCMRIGATCVIAIDALCARSITRLGSSYQLTNAGIMIGGGVDRGTELSCRTLGVPVIAIGVPTVISTRDLVGDRRVGVENLIVTPLNIDEIISISSTKIASMIDGVV